MSVILLLGVLIVRPLVCDQVYANVVLLFDLMICGCTFMVLGKRCRTEPLHLRDAVAWGLALACFWSLPGSVHKYATLRWTLMFCVYACVFIAGQRFSRHEKRRLLQGMVLVAVLIAVRALYQFGVGFSYLSGDETMRQLSRANWYAWELITQRRVVSWFAAPNMLAGYSISLLPFIVGQGVFSARAGMMRRGLAYGSIALALTLSLVMTKSVGALSGLLAGGMITAAVIPQWRRDPTARRIVLSGGYIVVSGLIGIVAFRAATLCDMQHPENSVRQRGYYWQSALRLIQQHPWRGTGAGTFGIVYPQVKYPQANETIFVHNSFLQLGAETGIVGGFLLLGILGGIVHALRRSTDPAQQLILCGSAAFLLHNVVDYTLFTPQAAIPAIILLACGWGRATDDHSASGSRRGMVCAGGIYGMLIVAMYQLAMVYAGERSIEQGIAQFSRGAPQAAIEYWERARRFIPWSDIPYYLLAQATSREKTAGAPLRTLRYYQQAIARNPRYAFYYYYLAEYVAEQGNIFSARLFLEKARAAYPHNRQFDALWEKLNSSRNRP